MNKKDLLWIKSMELCNKYWGCHQLPERSFFFRGYQLPVCARCTGIIIGYITSPILIAVGLYPNTLCCVLLLCPMALDGSIQYFTNYVSNNIKRVITGFLSGIGFISLFGNLFHLLISLIA